MLKTVVSDNLLFNIGSKSKIISDISLNALSTKINLENKLVLLLEGNLKSGVSLASLPLI